MLADHDPLSFAGTVFLMEEENPKFHELFKEACIAEQLPADFWEPIVEHSGINDSGEHGDISLELLSEYENVTCEEQIVIKKHLVTVLGRAVCLGLCHFFKELLARKIATMAVPNTHLDPILSCNLSEEDSGVVLQRGQKYAVLEFDGDTSYVKEFLSLCSTNTNFLKSVFRGEHGSEFLDLVNGLNRDGWIVDRNVAVDGGKYGQNFVQDAVDFGVQSLRSMLNRSAMKTEDRHGIEKRVNNLKEIFDPNSITRRPGEVISFCIIEILHQ